MHRGVVNSWHEVLRTPVTGTAVVIALAPVVILVTAIAIVAITSVFAPTSRKEFIAMLLSKLIEAITALRRRR